VVSLNELLGLKTPSATDQLTSFLGRAATVTILRYSGGGTAAAAERVTGELTLLRRVEWPDAKLLEASQIAPQPDRSPRSLVTDPTCRTP
jgi:hypothetical protein